MIDTCARSLIHFNVGSLYYCKLALVDCERYWRAVPDNIL